MTTTRYSLELAHKVATAHRDSLKTRAIAQLDWAGHLCGFQPDRATVWQPLIAAARETLHRGLASANLDALRQSVEELERILQPLRESSKTYTVHAVGHAHLDMNWIFSWPETVAACCDTMTTMLQLMDEFPDFRFSQDQASIYHILERFAPDVLETIKTRVREGRWEVQASHWVENDQNMVTGESIARELLLCRRYMHQIFGLKPADVPIHWCPDSFGHAAEIPRFMAQAGVKYYFFARPGANGFHSQPTYPPVFRWRAKDGSEVIAWCQAAGYNGYMRPSLILDHFTSFVRRSGGFKDYLFCYGVGDHGGGPTRQDILYALDMQQWPCFPTLKFSTSRAVFEKYDALRASLPVHEGELNHEMEGCYTSAALIKKCSRIAENMSADVESLAMLAHTAAAEPYPAETLTAAWRETLFAHFHDILPGSGIMETRTYMHGRWQDTMAALSRVETCALRALCRAVDTSHIRPAPFPDWPHSHLPTRVGSGFGRGALLTGTNGAGNLWAGDGWYAAGASQMDQSNDCGSTRPYVVFNPAPVLRREVATALVWDFYPANPLEPARLRQTPLRVRLPDGSTVPAQVLEYGHFWFHTYARIAFPLRDVPALGYQVVAVEEEESETPAAGPCRLTFQRYGHNEFMMENDGLTVRFDANTGWISSCVDKTTGLEFADAAQGFAALDYVMERHNWRGTAWVFGEGFSSVEPLELISLKPLVQGPYVVSFEGSYRKRNSQFKVFYELRAGDPTLHIQIDARWIEVGTPETGVPQLRFRLPNRLAMPTVTAQIPSGTISRPTTGQEFPAIDWVRLDGTLDGEKAGLLVLNEGKPGHNVQGGTLHVTLIRSSYDPDPIPEVGEHRIRLAVRPFAGVLDNGDCTAAGMRFNKPMRAMTTDIHAGPLPAGTETVTLDKSNLAITCLKKSEDGESVVIRLYETNGMASSGTLGFAPAIFGRLKKACVTDLLETPMADVPTVANTVRFDIPAHGIVTLKTDFFK